MISFLLEYEFAQRALWTGLMIGAISPVIGVFIVTRRLSVIGEVLSHMSLVGIVLGSIIGSTVPFLEPIGPYVYGVLFAVIGAFLVEWLRRIFRSFAELTIPVLLSFAIGLGVVLFSAWEGFNVNLFSYLFGNLLAVSNEELKITMMIGVIILLTILLLYKELFALTFDEEFTRINGIRTHFVQFVFVVMLALTVSIAIKAVGVLLVSGLMVLPVAGALVFSKGFRQTLFYSFVISEFSVVTGFVLSYYLNIASGGSIIVTALVVLIAMNFTRRVVFE